MWSSKDKPEIVGLTRALALEFRDMEPCPNDRPLNQNRKGLLKGIAKKKEFRLCEWSSCYCEETNEEYRVNGKHTSTAFMEMYENGEADLLRGIKIIRTSYYVETMEGMAKLYSTFDSRISIRGTTDINRVYAQCDERLASIATRTINLAVTAITRFKSEKRKIYEGTTPDTRAAEILNHPDFVVWMNELFRSAEPHSDVKALRRGPVAAVMFGTYLKAPQKAQEFWTFVRDASAIDTTDATRTLNKMLVHSAIQHGAGARSNRRSVTSDEIYYKCVYAWNSWRAGRKQSILKYSPTLDKPRIR